MKIKATVTYTVEVEIEKDDDWVKNWKGCNRTSYLIGAAKASADLIIREQYIDPEVVIHEF
jgi:hypothetical protein